MAVTIIGVTQLAGNGVGVPTVVAHAVTVSDLAAAVSMFSGVGTLVTTTYVGVGVPRPAILSAVGVI